jgi:ribosomal protein S18 acetylase RimI-like enzyme
MTIDIRILSRADQAVLSRVAPGVFDHNIEPAWAAEFLDDPRLHIAVALEGNTVVGFASGVHYLHPDKPPELSVNEVGVGPSHQGRGIGRQVLLALLERGRALGCREAWVLTSRTNHPAMRLYAGLGGRDDSEEAQVMFTFRLDGGSPAEA